VDGIDDFEWDFGKESTNVAKHGLSLRQAAELFASDQWIEVEAEYHGTDPSRTIAVGPVQGRLVVCIYTWRGRKRRVISLRPAHRSERRAYQEATQRSR
jgi:uncharacterized DUF497 family protein